MFIVTHDSFFANTKQFCHMHFLSRSNREVKDTQGSEGRFIFSPLEHLKPSMSTDPVQDPCIAGTGALCNLQSFRCPQHLRCCRSQRRIGISVANRPPAPRPFSFHWSLSSRQGLVLFTPNPWWQERRWGDVFMLTSCRAGKTESGRRLQASDSPQHTQTVCRTLQRHRF